MEKITTAHLYAKVARLYDDGGEDKLGTDDYQAINARDITTAEKIKLACHYIDNNTNPF